MLEAFVGKLVIVADGEVGEFLIRADETKALVSEGADAADIELFKFREILEGGDAFVREGKALVEVGLDEGVAAGEGLECGVGEAFGLNEVEFFEVLGEDESPTLVCPTEAHVEAFEFGEFGKGLGGSAVFDADATVEVKGFQFWHILQVADRFFDLVVLAKVEVSESGEALEGFEALVVEGSAETAEGESAEGGFVIESFEAFACEVAAVSEVEFFQFVVLDEAKYGIQFLAGSHLYTQAAKFWELGEDAVTGRSKAMGVDMKFLQVGEVGKEGHILVHNPGATEIHLGDAGILAELPERDGIKAFDGVVYVGFAGEEGGEEAKEE